MKFHHIAAVATGVAAAGLAASRSPAGSAAIQRSAITFARAPVSVPRARWLSAWPAGRGIAGCEAT